VSGHTEDMAHVLVVDDDPTVREVVASYLRDAGYDVTEAADGHDALDLATRVQPQLVILDLMLPGLDGLEVCRRLRAASDVPVIMLTALGDEADRVLGLELGADDYVTKPFSPRELTLRVGSVLRRAVDPAAIDAGPLDDIVSDGDLVLDGASRRVTLGSMTLSLTIREFDLLRYLIAHPGVAHTREDLLAKVWGWNFGDQSTVTVHVRRLREKIELDPSRPERLVTVWGIGYRWEPAMSRETA
jgi:DNA-binding response OmpR family regulator